LDVLPNSFFLCPNSTFCLQYFLATTEITIQHSLKLQVAVTHDPNKKEDRPILKRGEYMAGASIVTGRMETLNRFSPTAKLCHRVFSPD